LCFLSSPTPRALHSFPTRRSSDLHVVLSPAAAAARRAPDLGSESDDPAMGRPKIKGGQYTGAACVLAAWPASENSLSGLFGELFFGAEEPGLGFQHDRNAIAHGIGQTAGLADQLLSGLDRKSTRLNSSHV